MNIKIYDLQSNINNWNKIINKVNLKDIDTYFDANFFFINQYDFDSRQIMYVYSEKNNIWVNTFTLNKINKYFKSTLNRDFFDIETPYGYGGPLSNNKNRNFLNSAQSSFFKWCLKNNIIIEFVRFHPLIRNHEIYDLIDKVEYNRTTYSINFKEFKLQKNKYDTKTRNMIKKFHKNDYKILLSSSKKDFDKFIGLYKKNMIDKKTSIFYLFSKDYFNKLFKFIQKKGFLLCAFDKKNKLIGGSIFLFSSKYLHYHLSSTLKDIKYAGTNNAILDRAISIGINKNLTQLHLGGGNRDLDSLSKFKEKMSNQKNSFYIGKKIYNHDVYKNLINIWYNEKGIQPDKDKLIFYR